MVGSVKSFRCQLHRPAAGETRLADHVASAVGPAPERSLRKRVQRLGEAGQFPAPIFGSVPARSRFMFARCFRIVSADIAAMTAAPIQ